MLFKALLVKKLSVFVLIRRFPHHYFILSGFLLFQFQINRQQKDINQLASLCGYLEKKLIMDEGP